MGHEQVLADTEFFADAPASMLADVAASGKIRNLVRGDVLFEAGDEPDSIYVVLTGRIAIALGNRPFDHRESVIALMEEGDLFGEMGMLDKSTRSAGARALETSTVLEIPYTSVLDQLNASTSLMWNVVRMLSRRLRAMDQALADSVFLDVTGRTAKRLVDLSGGKDEFMLPVTQEELAGMVGASRERVNKAIASFIKLHWLEQHDRSYRILDRAKLEQRAL
jgi:CRP-like cAMP-binding protein